MIKDIFDEISSESSTNKKMVILSRFKGNELLKRVLYQAMSKRVKFFIKQIPEYIQEYQGELVNYDLNKALEALEELSSRRLTGHAGSTHLQSILNLCHPNDAYIIERIIEKDCKLGMGSTNVNKVFPDLIEKTPYMGAKAFEKKLIEAILVTEVMFGHHSQIKMDGRYCNAIIRASEVDLESRQGEVTPLSDAKFFKELSLFDDCVLNGELTMGFGISRYESNGIIASLVSISNKKLAGDDITKELEKFESKHMPYQEALDKIIFTVWDRITVDEYFAGKSAIPYYLRFDTMLDSFPYGKELTNIEVIESERVNTYDEAMVHFQTAMKLGHEGTVLKSANGTWKDGKPNFQIKLKKEINLDLIIKGFNYGTGKNKDLISSVNVESSDGLLKTSPTGINESMMKSITENQEQLLNSILEVKCSGLSQDSEGNYSVLHPVFKLLRDDKKVANSLEECIQIDKAAMGLS